MYKTQYTGIPMIHCSMAGQDRAGQGSTGQGRAGQNRTGQGRAGQGMIWHGFASEKKPPSASIMFWMVPKSNGNAFILGLFQKKRCAISEDGKLFLGMSHTIVHYLVEGSALKQKISWLRDGRKKRISACGSLKKYPATNKNPIETPPPGYLMINPSLVTCA